MTRSRARKPVPKPAAAPPSAAELELADGLYDLDAGDEVAFYKANEKPFGAFSNLARRPVLYDGQLFETAEHAYQYAKPRDPRMRDWLMQAPSPGMLAKTAHQLTAAWEVNPGWARSKVDRMRGVVLAKFSQHDDLRDLLLSTGRARLVERGTIDDAAGRFWGIPVKTKKPEACRNMLGRVLMEARRKLEASTP